MEMEYKDTGRRSKLIIALGVILALVAGATSFYLINQAQQSAGQGALQHVQVVVATKEIAARTPIVVGDVALREIALDTVTQNGVETKVENVVGKVLAVPVMIGQPIYSTMIASSSAASGFDILGPTETVGPDSDAFRAVSITIPDDRAIAGLLQPGQTVDIIMTAALVIPPGLASGQYYSDSSTKVTYQNVVILARAASEYVIRCTLPVAEEILHMQATSGAEFSAALRPDQDVRYADVRNLGASTNRIIQKYGLPFPVIYPVASGLIPAQPPLQTPTPPPSPAPVVPGASPSP
jgi:Flp pilus assembly protein CpaB